MHEGNRQKKDRGKRFGLPRITICFICTNSRYLCGLFMSILNNQLFLILPQYALYACSVLLSPNS